MGDFRRISFLFLWVLFSAGCVTLPENGPSTMTLNPNHTANLMMNYVEKEKQFGKAIELGKQMTAQQPSFAPAWYWMGVAYYAQNEYDQAITALKRVAELKPQTAQLPSSYEF